MKKVGILIVALLLMMTFSVSAEPKIITEQIVEATQDGETIVLTAKNDPAFWELPTIKSGESYAEQGSLILINNTNTRRTISLDSVKFPYEDEESLRYLNHLILRITDGERVLYHAPYSYINGANGFPLHRTLEAGQSATLSVSLYCDYAYTGEGLAKDTWLDWKFYTFIEKAEPIGDRLNDADVVGWLVAIGVSLVLLVVTVLLRIRTPKEPNDFDDSDE
jgi:hypothetical protein